MVMEIRELGREPVNPVKSLLCLHAGGARVSYEQLCQTRTPNMTRTWRPVPHHVVFDTAVHSLSQFGLEVEQAEHGIANEGLRYFGLLHLKARTVDVGLMVGLRNSHDKTLPAGLCAGSRVFVCDNLAFSGEVRLMRKHTPHILEDLSWLMSKAVQSLRPMLDAQQKQFEKWKTSTMDNDLLHALLIALLDRNVVCGSQLPKVLRELRGCTAAEWTAQDCERQKVRLMEKGAFTEWELFNATTAVLKADQCPTDVLTGRTIKLTRLLAA